MLILSKPLGETPNLFDSGIRFFPVYVTFFMSIFFGLSCCPEFMDFR